MVCPAAACCWLHAASAAALPPAAQPGPWQLLARAEALTAAPGTRRARACCWPARWCRERGVVSSWHAPRGSKVMQPAHSQHLSLPVTPKGRRAVRSATAAAAVGTCASRGKRGKCGNGAASSRAQLCHSPLQQLQHCRSLKVTGFKGRRQHCQERSAGAPKLGQQQVWDGACSNLGAGWANEHQVLDVTSDACSCLPSHPPQTGPQK
jgi:hypothetical protein